ncbi:hypothetical protein BKA70DRAFT_1223581 [Coprinopsis sp. MPI-PUGE-AT-0042]|nr:hypothetical protein BKA70DRAFT_1223581 [Coprinopsis sp. MPI-PUGE-AT-0042]
MSNTVKTMALDQLLTYSPEDLLELGRVAEEMFSDFNSAVASLDHAFNRYLQASQIWNLAGAPVALTIQTNLHALQLPDDVKRKLGESSLVVPKVMGLRCSHKIYVPVGVWDLVEEELRELDLVKPPVPLYILLLQLFSPRDDSNELLTFCFELHRDWLWSPPKVRRYVVVLLSVADWEVVLRGPDECFSWRHGRGWTALQLGCETQRSLHRRRLVGVPIEIGEEELRQGVASPRIIMFAPSGRRAAPPGNHDESIAFALRNVTVTAMLIYDSESLQLLVMTHRSVCTSQTEVSVAVPVASVNARMEPKVVEVQQRSRNNLNDLSRCFKVAIRDALRKRPAYFKTLPASSQRARDVALVTWKVQEYVSLGPYASETASAVLDSCYNASLRA